MKLNTLFKSQVENPKVSILLLDWSCRESFHALEYLNSQSVPRNWYEILWIEYYSRVSYKIQKNMKKHSIGGKPPLIDQWIVMGMPENVNYHKHLMYNVGILASRGKFICICDSDAIFSHTFVETIIQTFSSKKDIVLHLDEIRNSSKKFYPFNYPSIEEIIGEGCVNWINGKSQGVFYSCGDVLHLRNYGACMCALREDLIAIGGADEHIDYLGHICGPYEMTFRLINSGKKEIWHENEYIYHVWHPGTDGISIYSGPNDGSNLSTTALKIRETGRIPPLDENPAIRIVRQGLPLYAVQQEKFKDWIIE